MHMGLTRPMLSAENHLERLLCVRVVRAVSVVQGVWFVFIHGAYSHAAPTSTSLHSSPAAMADGSWVYDGVARAERIVFGS